ncbi:unnamed protein product [Nesidiocoris tenuis]|uniref:Citrate synthase n=1 Tax=Nesidiocoris tenuis TaxID=355587 RepID=A0A6H5FZV1_9HEMI|nr:unnamed protein product [Nesidiocoris tenuis]
MFALHWDAFIKPKKSYWKLSQVGSTQTAQARAAHHRVRGAASAGRFSDHRIRDAHAVQQLLKRTISAESTDLKGILAAKISKEQERIKAFRKQHGGTKVGEVTVDMMYGGMRGIKGLVCETSVLDPEEGIRFRGYSIPECQKNLPKAEGGEEPLPEGLFWLLITGDVPTKAQVNSISKEWAQRAELPPHIVTLLNNFPASKMHPMTQFSAAITALNTESKFAKAYSEGIKKALYWEYVYEDSMDLIAKLPVVAATIYRNAYQDGKGIGAIDTSRDWSWNFTSMLGFDSKEFIELMRLYLTIHSLVGPVPLLRRRNERPRRTSPRPRQPGGARFPDKNEERTRRRYPRRESEGVRPQDPEGRSGDSWLWPCRPQEDRSPLHVSEGVRPETPSQGSDVQGEIIHEKVQGWSPKFTRSCLRFSWKPAKSRTRGPT